jgi:hypothetical protein
MPIQDAARWQRVELRLLLAALRVMLLGLIADSARSARVSR